MTRTSLSALVAAGLLAGGLTAGSASAADLGGNCCADLEERVAELEATTARKGNRKVSLTISGFVAQQVLAWDDGEESNIYVTDTGSVSIGTHFKFAGEATIAPGWTAGYVLKIEAMNNDSLLVDQGPDAPNGFADDPGLNAQAAIANGVSTSLAIESSYWFVKNDRLGRLSVGQQSSAADNQAILPDGSGSLVVANYVLYDINGFGLRDEDGNFNGFVYGDLASCYPLDGGGGVAGDCDGYPSNVVRYDTPTFGGFGASASWGEDDAWAVSLRYAGEWNSIKVAAAIAYNENTDENGPAGLDRPDGFDGAAVQVGGYVQHVPTGLFLYAAYAEEYNDSDTGNDAFDDKPEGDMFYIKGGLRHRWNPLGHTVWYAEYGEDEDKMSVGLFDAFGGDVGNDVETELERWGLGVVQEVDAAAMSVWLSYRHYDPEITVNGFDADLEDFDLVKAGALINF